jgi:hypothetical protein
MPLIFMEMIIMDQICHAIKFVHTDHMVTLNQNIVLLNVLVLQVKLII